MSVKCSLGRLYRHMRSCRFPPYGPCGQIGRDGTPEPLSTQATGLAISARTKQLRHLVGPTLVRKTTTEDSGYIVRVCQVGFQLPSAGPLDDDR
jgi:hypothetical protein